MDYQQLRKMDLEQLKTSMYDAEPGSPWFEACLTEVNIRNANQMTATVVDMSQAMKEMKAYTAALDTSSRQTVEAMRETVSVSKSIEKSSKRIELATYAILLATLATLLEPFIRRWLGFR